MEADSFEVVVPRFEKGRILKKQALEELRDFPRSLAALTLANHTDGIVGGFDITCGESNRLRISSGLLRHQGALVLLHQERFVPVTEFGQKLQLLLSVREIRRNEDYETFVMELALRPCKAALAGEYELARFQLEEGARLRNVEDYTGLDDFVTEYNTLNLLHVPYSGAYFPRLPPHLTRYFAQAVMRREKAEPLDILCCMQALDGTLEREALICYISKKLHVAVQEYTNMELFTFLLRICQSLREGYVPDRAAAPAQRRTSIL